jgi:hypothetical protein
MQVFDATGKMVDAGPHNESETVDLNNLPAGVYILKVQDEAGSVATGKVIKY